jgi:hypothetical protein
MSIRIATRFETLVRYSSGMVLGLMLWTGAVQAHIGHDNEFKGGNAEQVMKPIEVEAKTAEAMGIKTEAIAAAGESFKVPAASIVDAGASQLVYVQSGTSFKPVVVKPGATAGDSVTIKEGNLQASDRVVSQGATLLYSQALRGGTPAEAAQAQATTQATAEAQPQAVAQATPEAQSSSNWLPLAIGGVVLVGGAIAVLSSRLRKSNS